MKRKGVLCFIIRDGKVLLVQFDYGKGGLIWNGLSGLVEPNEGLASAVVREIKEEIGIEVDPTSLMYKGTQMVMVPEEIDLEVFTATKWSGTPEAREASIKDIQWIEIDNLPFDKMFPGNKDWVPALFK